jgi:hypothetical protein
VCVLQGRFCKVLLCGWVDGWITVQDKGLVGSFMLLGGATGGLTVHGSVARTDVRLSRLVYPA